MTEQEIINILKENKEKGVAYLFLPEQVRDWVHDKLFDKILLVLDSMGNFIRFEDVEEGLINTEDYDNVVFALPGDYEPKQESKGEWVEFEIDSDGFFAFRFSDNNVPKFFFWWNWQKFLESSHQSNWGFTAFGGWLYDKSGGGDWVLSPQVGLIDDSGNAPFILNQYSHTYEKERITPAIPVKIRFWREKQ